MFCPKCKQTFEEGSRRFCPADGSRLIREDAQGDQWEGGIFESLIARPEPKPAPSPEESILDIPIFTVTEAAPPSIEPKTDDSGDFFILEDIEPDETVDPILTGHVEFEPAVSVRPPIKKIDPHQIPLGHVVLDETDRLAVSSADFRADEPEAFIGRTVKGRYVVTEYLGGDEFGYAFLADDKISRDRKVLVRILLRGDTDENLRSTLEEERLSLAHFSHPNIARLIDSGQFTDGTRYLVSEYVDALSAADILKIHGAFDPHRAARVIRQTAYALGEAHQEGIIHRDVRPANVILTPLDGDGDHVTLVNFGASTGEPTEASMAYKAPEVLDGRASTVSSDIYSLAVIAFEMVTGKLPFAGSSENDLLRAQKEGSERPSLLRRGLPRPLDGVLAKALSFKIGGRYVKARDFGDAFYNTLMETAIPAKTETSRRDQQPSVIGRSVQDTNVEPIVPETSVIPATDTELSERPSDDARGPRVMATIMLLGLLGLVAFGIYYLVNRPPGDKSSNTTPTANATPVATVAPDSEMPPPRNVSQPANTILYENAKDNLRGDLLSHFVGFKMFYPRSWKVNGSEPGANAARGNFIDISKQTPDGRMQEQMLVSYYPSNGTFDLDSDSFPQLVQETNDALTKLLPGYQIVSEGETKLNGGWRAYEVRFQAGGTSPAGKKLTVWGRRLFMPAARPGARNGFMITMLATSFSDDVHSVDDVGVKGELAGVLNSFEPGRDL